MYSDTGKNWLWCFIVLAFTIYSYVACLNLTNSTSGESLLDLGQAMCQAYPNPGNCHRMINEANDESWTIPKGFDPIKSWVLVSLPLKKYMCRLVVLKQFEGE